MPRATSEQYLRGISEFDGSALRSYVDINREYIEAQLYSRRETRPIVISTPGRHEGEHDALAEMLTESAVVLPELTTRVIQETAPIDLGTILQVYDEPSPGIWTAITPITGERGDIVEIPADVPMYFSGPIRFALTEEELERFTLGYPRRASPSEWESYLLSADELSERAGMLCIEVDKAKRIGIFRGPDGVNVGVPLGLLGS